MIEWLQNILPQSITEPLSTQIMGNSILEYSLFLLIAVIIFTILRIVRKSVLAYAKKLSRKTKSDVDDLIVDILHSLGGFFYVAISLLITLNSLALAPGTDRWLRYATIIIFTYYAVKALLAVVNYAQEKVAEKAENKTVISFLANLTKGIIWLIAVLMVLSNFGINVTSVMAGLGIGGIAVALALQNVLGDLFASVSILLDKPFKEGDFIIVGSDMGVVKKVGIKTTRIQSLHGQEIVISNAELTSTRVNNYKKLERRRIVYGFGVAYETPNKKLQKIKDIVKGIFDKIEEADLDRVHFKEYGDFSLNYEVVYYVDNADYNVYMDVQEEANLALKEAFEKEKIEFAYPTQRLLVEKQ